MDGVGLRVNIIDVDGFVVRHIHMGHPGHMLRKLGELLVEQEIAQHIGGPAVRQNIDFLLPQNIWQGI